ncbi:two-component system sensor histidine kinase NtrB [Desulfovibrio sp. TomC]|uniref:two-component system sensor histidine kinase NtrB n=1 Tax=Desulfovibrio sp. TomC TaxID=1562888 RepID=UPI0005731F14|nr:ATP-binding protein [Desulfovibrio sp. TomC]KHK04369.1 Signal transduction histidine kinase [Desulfovibrio sp. TomC]
MTHLSDLIAQNVVESLPVGLLIVDHTGAFATVNSAAAAILGYPREQLLGRGWGELFFENDANARFNQIVMDVIQNELVGLCRVVPYAAPNGGVLELSITSSYLSGDSNSAGVVVILHDITELSRMQRRETEILKEVNRIQGEKIRGLNKLAASVAHQIRNPIFAIGGFATRLSREIKDLGIASQYPGIILDEARRLETIVRTVARFASLGPLHLKPTTLPAVAANARNRTEAMTASLGRGVAWDLAAIPEVSLVADGDLLAAALTELFRNSIQFAVKDAVGIRLTAAVIGERMEIAVTDDGPGIPPADAPHIFDPFFSSRADGCGVGLTLAQEILLEHNGQIALDRDYAPGSRFTLSLPRFPSHLMSRLEDSVAGHSAPTKLGVG